MPYVAGSGGITDVFHSDNVYVNGVKVALWEPPGGFEAFMAAQGLNTDGTIKDTPENQAMFAGVDADNIDFTNANDPAQANSRAQLAAGQANGTLTGNTVPGTDPTVTDADNGAPNSQTGAVVQGNWAQWSASEYPKNHPIYNSVMLTDKTSLAKFTTQTALWGGGDPKWLKAQKGLTVPQILHNLSNLAKNTWEPLLEKYPNAIITNTFRQGASQAQHGDGMAMDIQFKGIAPSQYFEIAKWVRDNLPFDQLILEKASNAPWIHVSYWSGYGTRVSLKPINRVATMIVGPNTRFEPGLRQIA
jgi:hypothetical protein